MIKFSFLLWLFIASSQSWVKKVFNNAAGSAWKALQAEFKTIDSFIEPKKIPTKLEALGYVFKSDGILVGFFFNICLSFILYLDLFSKSFCYVL